MRIVDEALLADLAHHRQGQTLAELERTFWNFAPTSLSKLLHRRTPIQRGLHRLRSAGRVVEIAGRWQLTGDGRAAAGAAEQRRDRALGLPRDPRH